MFKYTYIDNLYTNNIKYIIYIAKGERRTIGIKIYFNNTIKDNESQKYHLFTLIIHLASLKLANNKGDTPISVSPAVAALARRLGQKDLPNNNLSPTNLNTGAPQPRRSVTATHQSPKKPGGRRFSKAEPHIMNLMGRSERVLHYREAQEHTPALRPNTSICTLYIYIYIYIYRPNAGECSRTKREDIGEWRREREERAR